MTSEAMPQAMPKSVRKLRSLLRLRLARVWRARSQNNSMAFMPRVAIFRFPSGLASGWVRCSGSSVCGSTTALIASSSLSGIRSGGTECSPGVQSD